MVFFCPMCRQPPRQTERRTERRRGSFFLFLVAGRAWLFCWRRAPSLSVLRDFLFFSERGRTRHKSVTPPPPPTSPAPAALMTTAVRPGDLAGRLLFRRRRGRAPNRPVPVAQEQRTHAACHCRSCPPPPQIFFHRPVSDKGDEEKPKPQQRERERKREPETRLDVCQRHVL